MLTVNVFLDLRSGILSHESIFELTLELTDTSLVLSLNLGCGVGSRGLLGQFLQLGLQIILRLLGISKLVRNVRSLCLSEFKLSLEFPNLSLCNLSSMFLVLEVLQSTIGLLFLSSDSLVLGPGLSFGTFLLADHVLSFGGKSSLRLLQ